MTTFTGELFSLLTALLWAGSAMIFAAVTGRISSVQANIARLILAECYLAVYLSVRSIPFTLSQFQLGMLLASGVIGLSLGDSFLFRAFQEIGAPARLDSHNSGKRRRAKIGQANVVERQPGKLDRHGS